jgi:MFS family permease
VLGKLRRLPLWQPLKEKPFRRLFLGEGMALLADNAFFVALTLLVVRAAGPGFELGSVLAVAAVPGAILMPVGGALADRFGPARMMLLSSAGRFVLVAAVAALVLLDAVSLWHLYLFGGLLSVLDALYYPSSLSAVPTVVGKERLGPANALVQGAEQASGTVGPVLAAFSMATVGLGATFGANALLFVASALAFWSVFRSSRLVKSFSVTAVKGEKDAAPVGFGGLLEGVRHVWGDPLLRALIFVLAVVNLAAVGPVVVGGAALAEARLGGAGAFGVLLSGFGAGSLLGFVVAGSVSRPRRRGPTLLGVTALLGLGLGALGFTPSLPWALAAVAVMGVGGGYLGVVLVAWLQERVEENVRGRVMGVVSFAFISLDPVSYALTGFLMELGLTATFAAAGALVVIAALLGAASREVRRFD